MQTVEDHGGDVLDPELHVSPQVSRPKDTRPVSADPEETLAQLEQLAAALRRLDSTSTTGCTGARRQDSVSTGESSSQAKPVFKDSAAPPVPYIVVTSSDKGQGITTLRAIIAGLD